jgi:hypothetical protein
VLHTRPALRIVAPLLVAVLATIGAPARAESQVRSSTATIRVTAIVPAALSISGATVLSRETADGYETITTRVMVRGNVSHRLEVRALSAQESEVRTGSGQWVALPEGRTVAVSQTEMIGETAHLVTCRSPVARVGSSQGTGCALGFAIASTDPQFPVQSATSVTTR